MKDIRECIRCGESKPLTEYRGVIKPSGNVSYRRKCKACIQSERRERYANDPAYREYTKARSIACYARRREDAVAQKAKYREENREEIKERKRKAYYADIEKSRKKLRDRYAADPDSAKKRREHRAKNIERERLVSKMYREKKGDELREKNRVQSSKWREANREKYNEKNREYYRSSIKRKIGMNLRNRINAMVRYKSGLNKRESLRLLIGCTFEEFKMKFESQFTKNMTWEKFLNGEIHIDHIKPCASFDLTKESEQKKCFHYTNLQPLWAKDNLSKGAKIAA
tara:strand:+ start:273 stop:1124 length:852 start_codon:yes stop_codon:yes gene_type:complete